MRVGICVRVSKNSLKTEEKLKEYCKDRNWKVANKYNATNKKLPLFEEIIKDVENKKIDVILVQSLYHLSRFQEDALMFVSKVLLTHDIIFISINDNIDTSTNSRKRAC